VTAGSFQEVLSGRAGLAGVQWLLDSPGQRRILRHQIQAMLLPQARVVRCMLRRARFRPGRKLKGFYDALIQTNRDEAHCTRPIAVTWTPDVGGDRSRDAGVIELQAEARRRKVAAPFCELSADVPQLGMRVLVWPLDPDFDQLVRWSSWEHVHAVLRAVYHAPAADQLRLGEHFISPIRYRPGQRHVLRYGRADAEGVRPVFAKLYTAEDGASMFERASRIGEWLSHHRRGVSAVRPFVFVAADGVVLYPGLSGRPLSEHLRRSHSNMAAYLERAGAALGALHEMPRSIAESLQVHDFTAEAGQVGRASTHIKMLLPPLGQSIDDILRRALELHHRLPAEAVVPAHGDFKAEHVWITVEGLTIMDFDSCCLAEPELDIAKFLAHLRLWYTLQNQPGLEAAQESFVAGYARTRPARRAAVRLYEALELVKITARRVPLFDPEWAACTEQLIRHAEAILHDLDHANRHTGYRSDEPGSSGKPKRSQACGKGAWQ